MIRAARQETIIKTDDIYWHIASGQVFQATNDQTTGTAAFTNLSENGGFMNGGSIIGESLSADKLAGELTETYSFGQHYNSIFGFDDEDYGRGYSAVTTPFNIPRPSGGYENGYGSNFNPKRQLLTASLQIDYSNKSNNDHAFDLVIQPQLQAETTTTASEVGTPYYTALESMGDARQTRQRLYYAGNILHKVGNVGFVRVFSNASNIYVSGAYSILGVWFDDDLLSNGGATVLEISVHGETSLFPAPINNSQTLMYHPTGWAASGSWVSLGYATTMHQFGPKRTRTSHVVPITKQFPASVNRKRIRFDVNAIDRGINTNSVMYDGEDILTTTSAPGLVSGRYGTRYYSAGTRFQYGYNRQNQAIWRETSANAMVDDAFGTFDDATGSTIVGDITLPIFDDNILEAIYWADSMEDLDGTSADNTPNSLYLMVRGIWGKEEFFSVTINSGDPTTDDGETTFLTNLASEHSSFVVPTGSNPRPLHEYTVWRWSVSANPMTFSDGVDQSVITFTKKNVPDPYEGESLLLKSITGTVENIK